MVSGACSGGMRGLRVVLLLSGAWRASLAQGLTGGQSCLEWQCVAVCSCLRWSRSQRALEGPRNSIVCQFYGVNYASCETELAQFWAYASLCGAVCLALVRVGALHVRRHASRQSRPGLDIVRGDGNRACLVPSRVASPRWHRRPLRRAERSYRAGIVVALPASSLSSPSLGSAATPSRAKHPTAPRGAYCR